MKFAPRDFTDKNVAKISISIEFNICSSLSDACHSLYSTLLYSRVILIGCRASRVIKRASFELGLRWSLCSQPIERQKFQKRALINISRVSINFLENSGVPAILRIQEIWEFKKIPKVHFKILLWLSCERVLLDFKLEIAAKMAYLVWALDFG